MSINIVHPEASSHRHPWQEVRVFCHLHQGVLRLVLILDSITQPTNANSGQKNPAKATFLSLGDPGYVEHSGPLISKWHSCNSINFTFLFLLGPGLRES